jgi:hypothetical protein
MTVTEFILFSLFAILGALRIPLKYFFVVLALVWFWFFSKVHRASGPYIFNIPMGEPNVTASLMTVATWAFILSAIFGVS